MPQTLSAALLSFMQVTGETQGNIEGGSTLPGREGHIELVEYGHSVSQAIDSATGVPAGDKQHRAIRVTKEIDKSSPLLMTAMTNSEKLTDVTIRFWRPSNLGKEIQFYTVELVNAYIANISHSSRTYADDDWRTVVTAPANETLTISYEKIVWTWEDGGITSEDDWDQTSP